MKTIQTATRLLRFGNVTMDTPAPLFDPVDLPFSVVWEARTGRRLDESGAPASMAGDPVGVWQSRASGNTEAAQVTFSARPVYQMASGKPVLHFAADDFLTLPLAADAPGFGDTITVVARVEAAPTGTIQMIASVGSSTIMGAWFLAFDGAGRVGIGAFGGGFFLQTAAPLSIGPRTIIARKNGTYASLRVDGEEVGVYSPATTLTARRGPLTIGAAKDYGLNLNGDLRFLAAAPNACLSDPDCVRLENYCANL